MEKKRRMNLAVFILLDLSVRLIKGIEINYFKTNGYSFLISLLIVFVSSFFLYYLVILIYDHSKMDPLRLENAKEKIEGKIEILEHSSTTRKIVWVNKYGNNFLLLIFVIVFDPNVTVFYCRKGHHQWNGIRGIRTWSLFIISMITCTLTFHLFINLLLKFVHFLGEIIKFILN
jgi:hypothetical protein